MKLQDFVRKPFQKIFIPTLCAIIAGVMCTAVDSGSHRLVPIFVWAFFALASIQSAEEPISTIPFYCFVLTASIFSALAVMMVVMHVWLAAVFAAVIASFPFTTVFTRKKKET